ncbi:MAG: menaquinone biosynthesis decarboxylase [Elusimicrobia bacterium]|nr:menaquinone biosynthesis decarboxylase [Elusimicrobiota bacterium]
MVPADLPAQLRLLEENGELRRIRREVDPRLEITEITVRVVKEGGPALLFENVKGSPYPVAINLFGTARRVELALGRSPQAIGERLAAAAEDLMPPRPAALWKHRGLFWDAAHMPPRFVRNGPVNQVTEVPNLDPWPILTCWPEDGGRFFTLPLVITQSPRGRRNVGMYRLHVYDEKTTGMHMQIERGGGAHYAEWMALDKPMPVAVALGGDPATVLGSVLPLPEDMDEIAFAGFLRGRRVPLVRLSNGVAAPADAEFILEGHIPPRERRTEGPFGDHFGHYSHAAPYPVFHIDKVHRRRNPIYPATVVGKPPQEDKYMGNAVQEMLLPLLKFMRPELVDLWAYQEAGFHNFAVAAVKQRYAKEAVKTALGLMGQGQMSLTKCVVLVDPDVKVRDFTAVLDALREHFDPSEDFILIPGTAQDTLDFTSFKMNLGSKMILDATRKNRAVPRPTAGFPPRGTGAPGDGAPLTHATAWRNLRDVFLVVRSDTKDPVQNRALAENLARRPSLGGFKFIAVVSDDVPLDDEELLIWGIFTRFDAARDIRPARVETDGAWTRVVPPLAIDASWKPGYPAPLVMDPAVVALVNAAGASLV